MTDIATVIRNYPFRLLAARQARDSIYAIFTVLEQLLLVHLCKETFSQPLDFQNGKMA